MSTITHSNKENICKTARIVHNKPCLDNKDAQAASDAVLSGWVAYGEIGRNLETKISQYVIKKDNAALLCSSGTASLYLALHSLNIKSGDEVILPSYSCTALLNAISMIGARAVVVDIDASNLSLTAGIVEKHITSRTAAIIAVHSYGIPCELDELLMLNLPVIEDCALALGSRFSDGSPVGSKGDLAIFSFYATKVLAAGYGGAVVSNNHKYVENIRDYLDFDAPQQYHPRFNFMLSDINAAVAMSQFDKLDQFMIRRQEIARRFTDAIGNIEYQNKFTLSNRFNHFRYLIHLPTVSDLTELKNHLAHNGIDTIIPLENRELLHNYLNLDRTLFPVSEESSMTILSIPIYPCLSDAEIDRIVGCLRNWTFA